MPIPRHGGSRAAKPVTSARADFVVIETHLSLGFWSNAKQSSTSGRCGWRCRSQFRDQPQDIGQQSSRSGDLGNLEGDITALADDPRADLDELYQVSLTMTDRPSLGFRTACASALSSSSMRAPHVGHIVGLQDYARPRDGYSRRSRIFSQKSLKRECCSAERPGRDADVSARCLKASIAAAPPPSSDMCTKPSSHEIRH
jgi:hypothetical protein